RSAAGPARRRAGPPRRSWKARPACRGGRNGCRCPSSASARLAATAARSWCLLAAGQLGHHRADDLGNAVSLEGAQVAQGDRFLVAWLLLLPQGFVVDADAGLAQPILPEHPRQPAPVAVSLLHGVLHQAAVAVWPHRLLEGVGERVQAPVANNSQDQGGWV